MTEPLPRQSLSDKVFQHLKAQLANRTWKVGDQLSARLIANDLDVSRTTINAAIVMLVEEGWVHVNSSRQAIVAKLPTKLKIHDAMEFDSSNQTDSTYEILLEKILRGQLGPGELIKERPLASELGVNPATLRRAAEWLCGEGLLERLPRRGWRVSLLSIADLKDIYRVRLSLEPLVVIEAVKWISEEDLDLLEEDSDRLLSLGEKATAYDRRDADRRFHQKLCEASGSRILAETLDPLIRKVLLVATMSFRYGNVSRTFLEHLDLLEAMRKRDGKEAAKRIKIHLKNGLKYTTKMWERY